MHIAYNNNIYITYQRFVHVDFEQASHIALRQVFPEVILKGCNFHFSQALNRKLQQLGLRYLWNDDGMVGEWIGCIKAMALLPECLIRPAFQHVILLPPAVADPELTAQLTVLKNNHYLL